MCDLPRDDQFEMQMLPGFTGQPRACRLSIAVRYRITPICSGTWSRRTYDTQHMQPAMLTSTHCSYQPSRWRFSSNTSSCRSYARGMPRKFWPPRGELRENFMLFHHDVNLFDCRLYAQLPVLRRHQFGADSLLYESLNGDCARIMFLCMFCRQLGPTAKQAMLRSTLGNVCSRKTVVRTPLLMCQGGTFNRWSNNTRDSLPAHNGAAVARSKKEKLIAPAGRLK